MLEGSLTIDCESLNLVVQKALKNSSTKVTEWNANRVYGGGGTSLIYHVHGNADHDKSSSAKWSVILKMLRADRSSPESWNYWKREALVYQSGIFSSLKRVHLPECYFVEKFSDHINIWLQDLNLSHCAFSSHDFEHVAYELGKMNALFVNANISDKYSYLSNSWLDEYVCSAFPYLEFLREGLSTPYVDVLFPGDMRQRLLDLWQEKNRMLKNIKSLPQTLCHLDTVSKNIFLSNQTQDIVLCDWACAGAGAIGQDLAALIVGSVLLYDGDITSLEELEKRVVPIYLSGLRDAGWNGNEIVPMTSFDLAVGLRYSFYGLVHLPIVLDESLHSWVELTVGHPFLEFLQRISCVQDYALRKARKANKFFC